MADNSTNLSLAGVVKWILIISSMPLFVKAWQGLIQHKSATNYGRTTGDLLEGGEAIAYGWQSLGLALLLLGVAYLVWRFWQENED